MSAALAPLRLRDFRWLLAARTTGAFGNAFAPIALAFAVLDLTGSARDLGLVVGARTLANVLLLLFGGVLADRLPRGLLLVGASVAAAGTQAAVAALVLTGAATVPVLIVLAVLNGMVAAVSQPASAALMPLIVGAEIRQQANGLTRMAHNGAMIIGASAGGALVALIGPGWGIAVDAGTFALSALFFAVLRLPTRPPAGPGTARPGVLSDLRTGWTEFRSRTWLWVVVAGFCLANMAWAGAMNVLGPVVADDTVGRQAWGLVLAAQTAGMVAGAVVVLRLRVRRLLGYGVVCCLFWGLPVLALGVLPQLPVLIAAAFLSGLAIEQFGIAWETSMQEHVPADRLARVYSYDMLGSYLGMPIGQIAIGPIGEAAGAGPALIGASAVMFVAAVGMLSSSSVRTLRHQLPEDSAGPMKESVS
ncbi:MULTISPECIES: MFS transporter [Actinoplanes]|uniref:MFS transporter n=1 Tax=Actinoplanes TaxID=1865 RepID=UPI0005F2E55D|nr:MULTISPECIES: MFS transporter [Actinoplanes]GLY07202.1 MFS transporter [Actinoplanes sp. NBRC 101535]